MKSPLRILYLEKDPRDVDLVQETLASEGIFCDVERVETEEDFTTSLKRGGFGLILADYALPSFDGISALKIAQRDSPRVPFIIVSGTLSEEAVTEALKIGATDYVSKNRLSRIVYSVRRVLREAEERAELIHAEGAQNERELRQIVDTIAQLVIFLSPEGKAIHANRFTLEYTGLTLDDVKADGFRERVFHSDDVERLREDRAKALSRGLPFENEQRARRRDGQYRWFFIRYNALLDEQGRPTRWYAAGIDIEDRKQAEEKMRRENLALRQEIDHTLMFEEIVGGSPALQSVLASVAKVAPTDSTVLITGETGTGKELFARAIHKRSLRSSRAFVSVNCAAIPATLIASELFGHEKGAFTGALQRRLGRFEYAEGGTIFLDEIGELPPETQIALLRVLQEREFERVGGGQTIPADVRVIAATNRDLAGAIESGTFRRDLFYRLNVFPIEIPPLRERREDIATLIEYFVQRYARKVGKKIRSIEKKTLDLMESYRWPGNIRELQNVIERSVIFCESDLFSVDPGWLSFESPTPPVDNSPIGKMSPAQERESIEKALAATEGRVSGPWGAAVRLRMPASTLESKIRALRINKFRFKQI